MSRLTSSVRAMDSRKAQAAKKERTMPACVTMVGGWWGQGCLSARVPMASARCKDPPDSQHYITFAGDPYRATAWGYSAGVDWEGWVAVGKSRVQGGDPILERAPLTNKHNAGDKKQ